MITNTPTPPYYTVVFTSIRTAVQEGYSELNDELWVDAQKLDGFIGADSLRNEEGFGITVLYFKNMKTIKEWSRYQKHVGAKKLGKEKWYKNYSVRIAKVELEYGL